MEWVSVKERFPKWEYRGQEWIVCFDGAIKSCTVNWWPELWNTRDDQPKITHWMPLPSPPGEKE